MQVRASLKIKHSEVKAALTSFIKLYPQLLPIQPTVNETDGLTNMISYSFRILLVHNRRCKRKPCAWNTIVRSYKNREKELEVGRILGAMVLPKKKSAEQEAQDDQEMAFPECVAVPNGVPDQYMTLPPPIMTDLVGLNQDSHIINNQLMMDSQNATDWNTLQQGASSTDWNTLQQGASLLLQSSSRYAFKTNGPHSLPVLTEQKALLQHIIAQP